MNNFQHFLTPEQAYDLEKKHDGSRTLEELKQAAKRTGLCSACNTEEIWRYGETGLCFSCTTGEADASEDYELEASHG